jgi:hypothetical protein
MTAQNRRSSRKAQAFRPWEEFTASNLVLRIHRKGAGLRYPIKDRQVNSEIDIMIGIDQNLFLRLTLPDLLVSATYSSH